MLFLSCVEALPLAEHVSTVEVYGNKTETLPKSHSYFLLPCLVSPIPNQYQINALAFFKVKSEQEISLPLSELSTKRR